MTTQFGAVTFPEIAPLAGESLTDPALDTLGAYLAAVLTAWAGAAWLTRSPNEPVVRSVLIVDPNEAEFIEKDLPALYLWRTEIDTQYIADEVTAHSSKIQIAWIPPPKASQYQWAQRSAFINGAAKALTAALELDRHPAWVAVGDPDPLAPSLGSSWMRLAQVSAAFITKASRSQAVIVTAAGRIRYPSIACEMTVQEFLEWDPTDFADAVPAALDLQIVTPDYDFLLEEQILP